MQAVTTVNLYVQVPCCVQETLLDAVIYCFVSVPSYMIIPEFEKGTQDLDNPFRAECSMVSYSMHDN